MVAGTTAFRWLYGMRIDEDHITGNIVTVVIPNTMASRAGIRVNDTIIQINDEVIINYPFRQLFDIVETIPPEELNLYVCSYQDLVERMNRGLPIHTRYNPSAKRYISVQDQLSRSCENIMYKVHQPHQRLDSSLRQDNYHLNSLDVQHVPSATSGSAHDVCSERQFFKFLSRNLNRNSLSRQAQIRDIKAFQSQIQASAKKPYSGGLNHKLNNTSCRSLQSQTRLWPPQPETIRYSNSFSNPTYLEVYGEISTIYSSNSMPHNINKSPVLKPRKTRKQWTEYNTSCTMNMENSNDLILHPDKAHHSNGELEKKRLRHITTAVSPSSVISPGSSEDAETQDNNDDGIYEDDASTLTGAASLVINNRQCKVNKAHDSLQTAKNDAKPAGHRHEQNSSTKNNVHEKKHSSKNATDKKRGRSSTRSSNSCSKTCYPVADGYRITNGGDDDDGEVKSTKSNFVRDRTDDPSWNGECVKRKEEVTKILSNEDSADVVFRYKPQEELKSVAEIHVPYMPVQTPTITSTTPTSPQQASPSPSFPPPEEAPSQNIFFSNKVYDVSKGQPGRFCLPSTLMVSDRTAVRNNGNATPVVTAVSGKNLPKIVITKNSRSSPLTLTTSDCSDNAFYGSRSDEGDGLKWDQSHSHRSSNRTTTDNNGTESIHSDVPITELSDGDVRKLWDDDSLRNTIEEAKLIEVELNGSNSHSLGMVLKSISSTKDNHKTLHLIDRISPGLPAHSANLHEGDIISTVNGIDTDKMSHRDIIGEISSNREKVVLGVKRIVEANNDNDEPKKEIHRNRYGMWNTVKAVCGWYIMNWDILEYPENPHFSEKKTPTSKRTVHSVQAHHVRMANDVKDVADNEHVDDLEPMCQTHTLVGLNVNQKIGMKFKECMDGPHTIIEIDESSACHQAGLRPDYRIVRVNEHDVTSVTFEKLMQILLSSKRAGTLVIKVVDERMIDLYMARRKARLEASGNGIDKFERSLKISQ